ncbi:unnamed protein product [Notodromas monacha]|uniref:Kinesin-associated protein 3 n=1 Tax=Notodromas monacha TaxID=399045 RepID=A0A7R9BFN5_9CRUS|nr:unnamed protein product [Notodromas monacha]CAG0913778.1 unnamed protein product [Notodromas monacha]
MKRNADDWKTVCFYLLLNLSEDPKVEQKMRSKGVIKLLVEALTPESGNDLVILVLTFLQRLSVYIENKNDMALLGVIGKLSFLLSEDGVQGHLFQCDDPSVVNLSLRLLFNLSFDPDLRIAMVKEGLMPKIVTAMGDERHRHQAVCVLYHLSMDDKCKSMFTYTQAIPLLMKFLLDSDEDDPGMEVMALIINLAANRKNAALICGTVGSSREGLGLKLLLHRAFKTDDPLIMKIIRNIAQHDGPTKHLFIEFVGDLVEKMKDSPNEELTLECLGVLGNLNLPELDWSLVTDEYELFPWLKQKLLAGDSEDDVRLEIIVLLGTMAGDDVCASHILKSGIVANVLQILNAKQEDDELVLQIVYLFHRFVAGKTDMREGFMTNYSDAIHYMIDLMHDANAEICKLCDATLDIVGVSKIFLPLLSRNCDSEWAARIKEEKFQHHNAQWLEMVSQLKDRNKAVSRRNSLMNSSGRESRDALYDDASSLDDSGGNSYDPQANLLDRAALFAGSDSEDTGKASSDSEEFMDANLIDNSRKNAGRPKSRYNNRIAARAEQ